MEMLKTICYFYIIVITCVKNSNQIQYKGNSFARCLKQDKPSLMTCIGQQALDSLQDINEKSNFTLTEGVVFVKEEGILGRSSPINFIDQDPTDFRSLLENAGAVMSERTLQWDMSILHPGLQMRVGPSLSGGLLEFVIDPTHHYDDRSHYEDSTARIMTKKFILPFLLGLKFNLATLLPLILGTIVLISKKAALLSKLALFISGFFGVAPILGSFGSYGNHIGGGHYGLHSSPVLSSTHHDLPIGAYKVIEGHHPRDDTKEDQFYEYDKKYLIKDRSSRLYERDTNEDKHGKFQRNFVWASSANNNNNKNQ